MKSKERSQQIAERAVITDYVDPKTREAELSWFCSCGTACDHMDDGWSQCNDCLIAFNSQGEADEFQTKELREHFESLPGVDPHLRRKWRDEDGKMYPIGEDHFERTDRCTFCGCDKGFMESLFHGHYRECLWRKANPL